MVAVGVIVALIVVFVLCVAGDLWLAKHPLKRADAKTEKYRYRGF